MKNTMYANRRSNGKIKRTIASFMAAAMMMTTAAGVSVFAGTAQADTSSSVNTAGQYNGSPIIDGSYVCDGGYTVEFKYSDGFFSTDPAEYNTHMATMSNAMAEASTTYVNNGDWSNGAGTIKEVLGKCGFENIEASSSYDERPTEDSIACAFGSKVVNTDAGDRTVISITVRSASYDSEWCSNVTLGTSGEAQGFSDSADKVVDYLNDYLAGHAGLKNALDNGKVSFWLSGFSRGGAVANLTAKRLIDSYQADGNRIYAYCLSAPQGGIAGAENADRDYSCIHNVINKDDIVPYVAPSQMGFERYGVDYYINDNITDMDNVNYQIAQITNNIDIGDLKPFCITGKTLNVLNLSIDDTDDHDTAGCIGKIMDALCSSCNRDRYNSTGLQDALVRLMQFNNNGSGSLKSVFGSVDKTMMILSAAATVISDIEPVNILANTLEKGFNMVKDAIRSVFTSDTIGPEDFEFDLNVGNVRASVTNGIANYLKSDSDIMDKLASYNGGAYKAVDDIVKVINAVLDSVNSIDDFITFGYNVEGILNNHSMIQSLGYLRAADDWF